jgi:hypothetical protein
MVTNLLLLAGEVGKVARPSGVTVIPGSEQVQVNPSAGPIERPSESTLVAASLRVAGGLILLLTG